jgi:hypothetical protein
MSFFIESYRALFIAAGLGKLSIAIELCSFGVCFVCIWFTAFYMGYGFYGIKFTNTIVHVFSLSCYLTFWYKSEFFEAWRAGEKNSSSQETTVGPGPADSAIYITNKFKSRVWPGPDLSEYYFFILIKKRHAVTRNGKNQIPEHRLAAPPPNTYAISKSESITDFNPVQNFDQISSKNLSTLKGYFKFSAGFMLLTSARTLWFDCGNLFQSIFYSVSSMAEQSSVIALFIGFNYFFSGYSISICAEISKSLSLQDLQAAKVRGYYALL